MAYEVRIKIKAESDLAALGLSEDALNALSITLKWGVNGNGGVIRAEYPKRIDLEALAAGQARKGGRK